MKLKWKSKLQRSYDKHKRIEEEYAKLEHWRTKFAWLPVRISETELVWLEKYEYRGDRSDHKYGWSAIKIERRLPPKAVNWHVSEQENS